MQGSVGRAAREATLHCGEDTFDQEASPALFCGEMFPHLEAYTGCPATGAAFGRDDILGLELLAAEGVFAFGVEPSVGQHAADGSRPVRLAHQDRQSCTFVPRCLASPLSQDDLPLHVDDGEPLRPVLPGALLLAEVFYTTDEIAAHRDLQQDKWMCSQRQSGSEWLPDNPEKTKIFGRTCSKLAILGTILLRLLCHDGEDSRMRRDHTGTRVRFFIVEDVRMIRTTMSLPIAPLGHCRRTEEVGGPALLQMGSWESLASLT